MNRYVLEMRYSYPQYECALAPMVDREHSIRLSNDIGVQHISYENVVVLHPESQDVGWRVASIKLGFRAESIDYAYSNDVMAYAFLATMNLQCRVMPIDWHCDSLDEPRVFSGVGPFAPIEPMRAMNWGSTWQAKIELTADSMILVPSYVMSIQTSTPHLSFLVLFAALDQYARQRYAAEVPPLGSGARIKKLFNEIGMSNTEASDLYDTRNALAHGEVNILSGRPMDFSMLRSVAWALISMELEGKDHEFARSVFKSCLELRFVFVPSTGLSLFGTTVAGTSEEPIDESHGLAGLLIQAGKIPDFSPAITSFINGP